MIFLCFLVICVLMDLKEQALDSRFLFLFGFIGILIGGVNGFDGREFWEILLSSGIGVLLFMFSKVTGGGIGEGDGLFFMISGMFLSAGENLFLFLSGLSVCSIYSLVWVVISFLQGKQLQKSFPFLPFLIPGGVWVICMK